jgi:hypothetical protein
MSIENTLPGLSSAFRDGRRFEQVVDALAKAAAGRQLETEDELSLEFAIDFLTKAKQGAEWIKSPSISEESKNWAYSFEKAATSFGPHRTQAEFIADIDQMLETAKQLRSQGELKPERISVVREFFNRVFRASIAQIHDALSQEPLQRNQGWRLADALAH